MSTNYPPLTIDELYAWQTTLEMSVAHGQTRLAMSIADDATSETVEQAQADLDKKNVELQDIQLQIKALKETA